MPSGANAASWDDITLSWFVSVKVSVSDILCCRCREFVARRTVFMMWQCHLLLSIIHILAPGLHDLASGLVTL
jgi:hypothetical protein